MRQTEYNAPVEIELLKHTKGEIDRERGGTDKGTQKANKKFCQEKKINTSDEIILAFLDTQGRRRETKKSIHSEQLKVYLGAVSSYNKKAN